MFRTLRARVPFSRGLSSVPTINYHKYVTERSLAREQSPIRALQPLLSVPGMISLGGGMPNPTTFPISGISIHLKNNTTLELSEKDVNVALQYSPTKGIPELVEHVMELQLTEHDPPEGARNNLTTWICSGSQDGLAKAFEAFVHGPEDAILVENPTYSGSLAALRPIGCKLVPVDTDEQGIIPDSLDAILSRWDESRDGNPPKVLYTIPTGCNPSGATVPLERRQKVYDIACKHDLIIMEDDPYYYLQFGPPGTEVAEENMGSVRVPSLLSMDTEGRVLRFDSLSKLLSAGLRIGFVTGPKELVERIELHTQASNLHTSGMSQAVTLALLKQWKAEGDGFQKHANKVASFYRGRRDVFLKYADKHLKEYADWTPPTAGMFMWMKLRDCEDSAPLIQEKALEHKVILLPGNVFMSDGGKSPYVRASFSLASDENIDTALSRFAKILRNK